MTAVRWDGIPYDVWQWRDMSQQIAEYAAKQGQIAIAPEWVKPGAKLPPKPKQNVAPLFGGGNGR